MFRRSWGRRGKILLISLDYALGRSRIAAAAGALQNRSSRQNQ
jgi:hypothetical protein